MKFLMNKERMKIYSSGKIILFFSDYYIVVRQEVETETLKDIMGVT
jgi:hypothetical protein